jgi:hypothetical protein
MHTGTHGATPEDQVNAINRLFRGLVAEPDNSPTFAEARDEILSDRPFRTANPVHARTVGGFRSERDPRTREKVDKAWLLIYDPEPPNDGRIYKEIWDEKYHRDFIYVKSR